MASRFKMPLREIVHLYGNVELVRKDENTYVATIGDLYKLGVNYIVAETYFNRIGAKIMRVNDLINSGLAHAVYVEKTVEDHSCTWKWNRVSHADLWEGTYSHE